MFFKFNTFAKFLFFILLIFLFLLTYFKSLNIIFFKYFTEKYLVKSSKFNFENIIIILLKLIIFTEEIFKTLQFLNY